MSKVSIIVPNYNHHFFLKERLDSIYNQKYQDFEVIILDDFSTDNSREIIDLYKKQKNTRIIYGGSNSGNTFKQWKKGIEMAIGDFIWIAESDDSSDPNFLSELIPLIENNKSVGLVYCQSRLININSMLGDTAICWTNDLSNKRWNNNYFNLGKDEIRNFLLFKNTIPNASAVIFRKEIAQKIKYFPTSFKLCGDWIFWIQLLSMSDLIFCSNPLNFWRQNSSNVRVKIPGTLERKESKEIFRISKELLKDPEINYRNLRLLFIFRTWKWQLTYYRNNLKLFLKTFLSYTRVCK